MHALYLKPCGARQRTPSYQASTRGSDLLSGVHVAEQTRQDPGKSPVRATDRKCITRAIGSVGTIPWRAVRRRLPAGQLPSVTCLALPTRHDSYHERTTDNGDYVEKTYPELHHVSQSSVRGAQGHHADTVGPGEYLKNEYTVLRLICAIICSKSTKLSC
jgi:hypothetical protein